MQIKPSFNDAQGWPVQAESAENGNQMAGNGSQVRKPKSCRGLPANATRRRLSVSLYLTLALLQGGREGGPAGEGRMPKED